MTVAEEDIGLQQCWNPEPDPVIVPAEEQHLQAICEIWQNQFGCDRDVAADWLTDSLDEDYPHETFVALNHGEVLGFGVAGFADPDFALDYIGLKTEFEPWPKTGIFHMGCVCSEKTGLGIGTELFKKRFVYLAGICEVDGLMGIAWHRQDGPDARALFEDTGFQQRETWDRYYARTHGRPNCPVCQEECGCTASLYTRRVQR
jgi:GNAT superfamily N-acetyltransferase